ncbi:transglycosylase domain-containing protein [Pseudonocardia sp. CA-107938]|uniref:transglycosylase domain-containing protein n=1 Tax=Pseudonocardia sp. CA-107938 TaxID=3240021 RepID=UPI003D93CE93
MAFPVVGGIGVLAGQVGTSAATVSDDLRSGVTPATTVVTDSAGVPLAYLYDQFRIPVPGDRIAPSMKAAIVAIEDRRFYDHGGVDPIGTARALVNDANGGAQQGGSTLTQQYVKNYELYVAAKTDAARRAAVAPSITRKVKEAELALQLDNELSKADILSRYLDVVYFGHGAYGVGAAAKVYFDTTADKLTVAQSALLAGMVQSPSAYDPAERADAAKARRDTVIAAMQQQGAIDATQAAAATAAPLGTVAQPAAPGEGCTGAGDAGYFCLYVERYLQSAGISAEQLASGGYTVRTTLDRSALTHLKAAIDAADPPDNPHVADVMAIVAPGQDSHRVVALAANRPFGNGPGQSAFGLPSVPENLGAGSVYKIFTSAAALDQGVAGIDSILDVPPSGATMPNYVDGAGHPLPVRNAGNYPGQLSLTDALAQSPNTAFVELEGRVGVPAVVDMAVKLGMTSLAQPGPNGGPSIADVTKKQNQASFTLGVTPTSALELANVDATLASHGMWCPPNPIVSVTDRTGAAVPVAAQPCTQAVPPGLADTLMNGLSKDDQPGGTSAAAAAAAGWNRPIGAKTGTTQEYKSAAFVGATPQLAAAAIVFDDSRSPQPICIGDPPHPCGTGNIYGGTVPARTFYPAMQAILAGQPVLPLPPPDPTYLHARNGNPDNTAHGDDGGDGGGDGGGENADGGN